MSVMAKRPGSKGAASSLGGLLAGLLVLVGSFGLSAQEVQVETVSAFAGASGFLDASAECPTGISGGAIGLCFDRTLLDASLDSLLTTPGFASVVSTDEGLGLGFVTDLMLIETLAAGVSHPLVRLAYQVSDGAEEFVPVEVCSLLGASPPLLLELVDISGASHPVTAVDGGVEIVPPFLRGDFDGDSAATILDAILILNWGFLSGSAPLCLAAVDVDGSGQVELLSDALRLLGHLFLGDSSPPAPYPVCGPDPLGPMLDCSVGGVDCP